MTTAVVVGSGPNGLAAAVRLAEHGVSVRVLEAAPVIGGGTRSGASTVPGLVHDECSAFHPMGFGSPYLSTLGLGRHGLRWAWPEVQLAHPLDDGSAGAAWRDLDTTAAALGPDGPAWRSLFAPRVEHYHELAAAAMGPQPRWPAHPVAVARFGCRALLPTTWTVRRWSTPAGRALFGGVAAHAIGSLRAPLSSAVGILLTAATHACGWPVAVGGSRAITDALAARLAELGGTIEVDARIDRAADLPAADVVLLGVAPRAALALLGDRLPRRVARAYARFRHGPGAFKLDLAVEGGVPWRAEVCRRAGTVHVGGSFEEVVAAEADVVRGRMPERPFMLVGQQYLADPGRSAGDVHPVWAYAHVPQRFGGDATDVLLAQIERFAPGCRDRIVGMHVRTPADLERDNANYVGGDIATGASAGLQAIVRPRLAVDPYATGIPGVFLCSAATPPGAGVHGMCGYHAAGSALRHLARTT